VAYAVNDASVRQRLEEMGALPVGSQRGDFASFVARERDMMADLIRKTGMVPQ
jgi:tripartite-type tricarboxylate transporter receptor subunit TctC